MSEIYQELADLIAAQGTAAYCVIVSARGSTPRNAGTKMLVYPDGTISGTVGGGELEQRVIDAALTTLKDGQPQMISYSMTDPERGDPGVCGGQLEVYVEPILPQASVIVIGAGHVGREVAALAKWLGYAVVISDDRAELLTDDLAEHGQTHHGSIIDLTKDITIHSQSYIVMTTRNVDVDVAGLPSLFESEAAFIGVIGSRRRWETTKAQLRELRVSEEKIASVVSPVGLELEAETPREIALSILAQITMLRHGGHGSIMSDGDAGS
jgi:xanthine dehydrogenase accessory factor